LNTSVPKRVFVTSHKPLAQQRLAQKIKTENKIISLFVVQQVRIIPFQLLRHGGVQNPVSRDNSWYHISLSCFFPKRWPQSFLLLLRATDQIDRLISALILFWIDLLGERFAPEYRECTSIGLDNVFVRVRPVGDILSAVNRNSTQKGALIGLSSSNGVFQLQSELLLIARVF